MSETYGLIVVGCGAAGLSTAVSYSEAAKAAGREPRVAVLERAPEAERGGASRWTGAGMRVDSNFVLDPQWVDEMQRVSKGLADLEICRVFEREVPQTGSFLRDHGIEFVHNPVTIGMSIPTTFPKGDGLAIVDSLARALREYPGVKSATRQRPSR